jgi:hypothetical protein
MNNPTSWTITVEAIVWADQGPETTAEAIALVENELAYFEHAEVTEVREHFAKEEVTA